MCHCESWWLLLLLSLLRTGPEGAWWGSGSCSLLVRASRWLWKAVPVAKRFAGMSGEPLLVFAGEVAGPASCPVLAGLAGRRGAWPPFLPGGPGVLTRPGCPEPAAELGSHLGLRMLRLTLQQLLGPPCEVSPCAVTAPPLQGLASAAGEQLS